MNSFQIVHVLAAVAAAGAVLAAALAGRWLSPRPSSHQPRSRSRQHDRAATYERRFRELDDLLFHLKGLVLVRALLEERGASEAELREHGDAIVRVRAQLAELVETSGGAVRSGA